MKPSARRRVFHRDCSYVTNDRCRGRAKQEFRDSSNINVLIAKYRKIGVWPSGSPELYEDSASWPKDLAEAFAISARAAEQFEALPAQVRRRLGNDPRRLLELTDDDLEGIRKYVTRQAPGAPDDQGSGGGRPPGNEPKATKKPEKADEDDQE